jgi:hypothetical protein
MEEQQKQAGRQANGGMNPDFAYALFYLIFFLLLLIVAGFGLIAEF